MNKLTYIFFLSISLLLVNCSKKNSDKIISQSQENVDHSWRSGAPSPGPARTIELGDYNSFDLDNGLKVIVVENHKLPRVSYQISLLNNPIAEGEKSGYVSMAGDLLKTGTTNRSKAEIDETIDFYGANLSTFSTGMFLSSLKKHSESLMDIFTDILYNPSFPEDEFEKLKTQTLSNLASQKTDPNSISNNVRNSVLYGKDHPYGEVQTEKTTRNITIDDLKSYYNVYFKPNNAYLIIVGDITVDEAKEQANKYFSNWEKGDIPQMKYTMPTLPKENKVVFSNKDGAVQSVIKVAYPIELRPDSEDLLKARAMNQILGGGVFSGRLMQNLREDKAYTYGARSSISSDPLVGNFSAGASVRNEVTDSSVHEFLYELKRMVSEPVDPDDLLLTKNSMAGSFARSLESPQTIANFARNTFKYNLPNDYYNTYLSRLEEITPDDITEMAKKYIKPENAYIIVVGNKDEVAEKLTRFDADGKIEYYGSYGEPVNFDKISVPEGITANEVISDYISAIGGKEKLEAVKSLITKGGMNLMGQEATLTIKVKSPNKMVNKMEMNGMVMQEQKFDGNKASISGMGQSQVFESGSPEFDQAKNQSILFEQLFYNSDDIIAELKSIEEFEGEKCYKLIVQKGDLKETQYYNLRTNLLLATVMSEGEGEQTRVVTTTLGDYKEVGGIQMFPHSMTVVGAAPFPLEMKINEYILNQEIDDIEFTVK